MATLLVILETLLETHIDFWVPREKPFVTSGDLWRPVATSEDLWGPVGTCGDLSGNLAGDLRRPPQTSLKTPRNLWKPVGTNSDLSRPPADLLPTSCRPQPTSANL